jgi:hypothetical protein
MALVDPFLAPTDNAEVDVDAVTARLDALEAAAPPGFRAEYIRGAIVMNRPVPIHSVTIYQVTKALDRIVPDGYVPLSDLRVGVADSPTTPGASGAGTADSWIVPDIVVVEKAAMMAPGRVDDTRPLAATDVILAVEVLSRSTADIDRGAKVDLWRQAGVDYWVVEPGDPWGAIEAHPFGRGRVDPEKL